MICKSCGRAMKRERIVRNDLSGKAFYATLYTCGCHPVRRAVIAK